MDLCGEICQYNPRDEELRYIFDANITLKQLFLQSAVLVLLQLFGTYKGKQSLCQV